MKRIICVIILVSAMLTLSSCTPFISKNQYGQLIQETIEYPHFTNQRVSEISLAGKVVWNSKKGIWKRQISIYNKANRSMVTQELIDYVLALNPDREGRAQGESYGYCPWTDLSKPFSKEKCKLDYNIYTSNEVQYYE